MGLRHTIALLTGLGLAPGAALAEEGKPSDEAGTPSIPSLHGELSLSLRDAIAMGIENNLDVALDRYSPLIASEDARAAWGAYDPTLFGSQSYESDVTPSAVAIVGLDDTKDRALRGSAGLRGLVPKLGASYELSYSGQSLDTDRSFQTVNPEYRTTVQATGTLPLMKGLLWNEPWVQVKITGIARGQAEDGFRSSLMDTVRSIENAYWGLVAADQQLRVAEKSLETTRALLDQTQAQYEVGVVSRVEVVESEAGLAEREFNRIERENFYLAAQDALIDVVLGPNLRVTSRLELRPTDAPEPVPYPVDPGEAAERAFASRPELAIARKEIEQREIELRFANNKRLPQLDLVGSYGFNGLSGEGQTIANPLNPGSFIPAPPIDRRYTDADDDFFSGDGAKSWSAGAVLSFPLGNRSARAGHRKAEFELQRSKTRLRRVEQNIVLEVRSAVRNLRSALQGIEAAERRRLAAAEQHRAEQIRLEHGESTPFNVLERDEDMVEAQSEKIRALQVYRASITALDRAQGTILTNRNVIIDEARALR